MEKKKKPFPYYEYNEYVANQPCWTENPNHGRKDDRIHHAGGFDTNSPFRDLSKSAAEDEWSKFIVHELPVVKAVKE